MDLGLSGRVAMVSGASKGIGRAVAELLAKEGVRLSLCARNAEEVAAAARAIEAAHGVDCIGGAFDLTQADAPAAWVEATIASFGRVDILVNNAGAVPSGDFFTMRESEWLPGLEGKMLGYARVARAVLPGMFERRQGAIVNVIGTAAAQPMPGYVMGSAANAAIVSLTKGLANEAGRHNVRVNGVSPGSTRTERWTMLAERAAASTGKTREEAERDMVSQSVLGRAGEPSELADVIVFLASDRASYVTGAVLNVDGGMVKGI
jgi:NAD(P)-dependent dehydrogenase (short-subunit alcohol dehydrogenase family)